MSFRIPGDGEWMKVTPKSFDEIIWETPLDERVYFLTSPVGRTSLLAKNIEVEVREQ